MPLLEIIALGTALLALIVSGWTAAQLARLRRVEPMPRATPLAPALPDPEPSPLEGLTIEIQIEQDHPHPVFANLLRERLLAEDVAEVLSDGDADLTIAGSLECNGYADIYYTAELECRSRNGVVRTWVEKPAHGDRPVNLANQVAADLRLELTKLVSRSERRRALRELQSP